MIKIALVDDHKLLRSGLSNFINNNPDFEVVLEADNGLDFQQQINQLKSESLPDVVLMDINMPLIDGYATTEWVSKHHTKVRVIALSMYDNEECIIRMLRKGAKGYLLKDTDPFELLKALKEVYQNGFYYSPMVAKHMATALQDTTATTVLTNRELELLQYMATELTYKEIAEKMFLSIKTVETHREKLCDKLNVKTRIGLVIYALKNGIIQV